MTIYLIKTFPILLITVNGIEHCLRICNTKFAKAGTNKHYTLRQVTVRSLLLSLDHSSR